MKKKREQNAHSIRAFFRHICCCCFAQCGRNMLNFHSFCLCLFCLVHFRQLSRNIFMLTRCCTSWCWYSVAKYCRVQKTGKMLRAKFVWINLKCLQHIYDIMFALWCEIVECRALREKKGECWPACAQEARENHF